MKKPGLYLDTSVLNFAVTADASLSDYRKATLDLLKQIEEGRWEGFVSELVLAEINRAPKTKVEQLNQLLEKYPFELLSLQGDIEELADKYLKEGLIPPKYRNDALHIATASFYGLDAVVSWNFEHMVKLRTKQGVVAVNGLLGYKSIEIVSPLEVG